jgi:hypothetical protein
VKSWVEEAAAMQGIVLAPGRAGKIAPGVEALLDAAAKDPLRAALAFEADPTSYLLALKSK